MPADPLHALAQLRRLELDAARLALADKQAREAAALDRRSRAEAAPAREAAAADPAVFARWLPRALAERERATRVHALAGQATEASRTSLVLARVADRALERLREERAAAARRERQRREASRLDEAAARRR